MLSGHAAASGGGIAPEQAVETAGDLERLPHPG